MATAVSLPVEQCHFMDAFPYFKNDVSDMKTTSRAELKNRLMFLTELSRFLNRKAPFLLQVSDLQFSSFLLVCYHF